MYSSELTNTWLQTRQPEWIKKKKEASSLSEASLQSNRSQAAPLKHCGIHLTHLLPCVGKTGRHKYRQGQYCNLWYLSARFWNVSMTREMDDLAGNDVGIMGHKEDRRLGLKQKCFVLKKPFEVIISVQQIYGPSNLWSARLAWVFLPLLS